MAETLYFPLRCVDSSPGKGFGRWNPESFVNKRQLIDNEKRCVDWAAETQSPQGFLSELFPNTLPRKGMETILLWKRVRTLLHFPNTLPRKGMETLLPT